MTETRRGVAARSGHGGGQGGDVLDFRDITDDDDPACVSAINSTTIMHQLY